MSLRLLMRLFRTWPLIATALSALGVASCGGEDRIVTATCETRAGNSIALEFKGSRSEGTVIGLLNTQHFIPGTILELIPSESSRESGSGKLVYVLPTRESDFRSPQPENWDWSLVNVNFDVEMDGDVKQAVTGLNMNFQMLVSENTRIQPTEAWRKVLKDPLRVINRDGRAITLIRRGEDKGRFVVVSAVSYGSGVTLNYAASTIAANTVEVSDFYLHVKYECGPVDAVNARARRIETDVPIFYFYLPVKYNEAIGAVDLDVKPNNPAMFNIVAEPPE
jgi:hypothetical protein